MRPCKSTIRSRKISETSSSSIFTRKTGSIMRKKLKIDCPGSSSGRQSSKNLRRLASQFKIKTTGTKSERKEK